MFFSAGKKNQTSIGSNFLFSDGIELWNSDTHSIIDDISKKRINKDSPILIGNNVWLGTGSIILKGDKIGDNSIVAAKSLVTKNIDNNTLVAGIPVNVLKNNVSWTFDRVESQ